MTSSENSTKFSCIYCQDDVRGILIKCAQCQDFPLCLQCFAAGAEMGSHKKDHAYQFINSEAQEVSRSRGGAYLQNADSQELFKSKGGWSGREELILLNGIEGYGFGNWKHIALKLETKTAEECREEYLRTFLYGNIGKITWPSKRPDKKYNEVVSPCPSARMEPIDIVREQSSSLGYMPLRDDYEKEYSNNAESIISDLNVNTTEDDKLDIALKLAEVDTYVEEVRERERRKRIAKNYHLVSKFFNQSKTRSHSTEQTELEEKLRLVLCQFLTCYEYDSFIPSWLREVSLRRRAAELMRYRQNGLTRYEEIPFFEQESCYRSDSKPNLLFNPSTSPGRCPPLERATDCQTAGPSADLWTTQVSTQDYSHPPRLSPHHLPQLNQPQAPQHLLTRKSERSEETAYSSTGRSSTCHTDTPRLSQPIEREQPPLQHSQPSSNLLKYTEQPSHLLSSTESQLCATLDLTPSQYISIKTVLLTRYPQVSDSKAEKCIFDYMNTNGWFVD